MVLWYFVGFMALTDTYATKEFFSNRGLTSGSNLVPVITHSIDDTRAFIVPRDGLGCLNLDNNQVDVSVFISGSGGLQTIERVALMPNERWTNTSNLGVFPGEHLYIALGNAINTTENSWNVVYFQVAD